MHVLAGLAAHLGAAFGRALTSSESAIGLYRITHSVSVLATFAVLLAVGCAAWRPIVRSTRAGRPLVAALLVSFVVILGVTLVPVDGWRSVADASWSIGRIHTELGRPVPGLLTSWARGSDGPLNVVLFVPAGFLCGVVFRRGRAASLLGLGAMSLVIECLQAFSGLRYGSLADVMANTVGAGLGLTMAAVVTAPGRLRRVLPALNAVERVETHHVR
jgi:hypothetical protein